jgi:NADPH:quinone reductase-like Zn-dependent oxidoreductase
MRRVQLPQPAPSGGAGRLRVRVGLQFARADAARAHRLGKSGRARGKMILHVGAPQA